MKKLIIIIVLCVIFGIGCLKDEKMNIHNIETPQNTFEIEEFTKVYKPGEIVDLNLKTIENIDLLGFDLYLNTEKFELYKVEKYNFTENENFIASINKDYGYHIIFVDFKKMLQKNDNFAKIQLLVKWYGEEIIEIKNIVKE